MGDIISTMEALIPREIIFPKNLLCEGQLDSGYIQPLNQTCLRSCADINFTSWLDPLAFAVCDTDIRTCKYMKNLPLFNEPFTDTLLWKPFLDGLDKFYTIVLSKDLACHRLCTWVSFITVIPVLSAIIGFVVVLTALVTALVDLLPALVAFFSQLYIFYES